VLQNSTGDLVLHLFVLTQYRRAKGRQTEMLLLMQAEHCGAL